MENIGNLPVAKRTRNQKENMLREHIKRARLAARKEWIKRVEKDVKVENGDNLCDDGVGKESPIRIISRDEFNDRLNCCGSKVKKEIFDDDFDYKGFMFDGGKNKDIKFDYVKEGYGSDDSEVVFLGERYDPSVLKDDDLMDDDDDDDDDDMIVLGSSESEGAMKGSKFNGNICEEGKIDLESSSSSSEEDDVESDKDYESDDDDDCEDDEVGLRNVVGVVEGRKLHCNNDKIILLDSHGNEVDVVKDIKREELCGSSDERQHSMSINEDGKKVRRQEGGEKRKRGRPPKCKEVEQPSPIPEGGKEVERQESGEKRKRGRPPKCKDVEQLSPMVKGGEEVKRQESGEKRKRGRPRKNNEVEVLFCSSSMNGGKKFKDNNEIRTTLLDPISERGNEGLYESLYSSSKNGGKRLKNSNELQNTVQDTYLEGINEGLDHILSKSSKNGGKKLKSKSGKTLKRNNELQNALLHTILEGDEGFDGCLSHNDEFNLQRKFRYGIKEEIVPQKPEEEIEVENLSKGLEFALQACNIGVDESSMNNNGDIPSVDGAISQEVLCSKGKHDLILDEEIGMICRFCSQVVDEIKDVMPDFNEYPFGKKDSRDYYRLPYEDNITYDGFEFPDSSYDCLDGRPSPSDDIPGTVWDLIPGVRRKLYPHQREGLEFIWRNVAGGIKIAELGEASQLGLGGCIICHAPGTGKTRLAIVFLQSFMKLYKKVKPVIVAPYSMLRTWEDELTKWNFDIPFFNLNEKDLTGKEDPKILKCVENVHKNAKSIRFVKLMTWASGKGVLAISYGLLQRLAGEKEGTDEMIREVLLKQPGIVFLDEGHTPRNENSNIWQVLSDLSTKRRVILSGTPFQNNFEELHNTIALVREEFGGPVLSGYYEQDDRRIQELRKRIIPFVHVHNGEILKKTLKGLFHSLLILKPSLLQKKCFALLTGIRNRFKYDNLVSTTAVHPSILSKKKLPFVDEKLQKLLRYHRMDANAGVKTMFLIELIKLIKGERVLVFGQYLPPLKFIVKLLKYYFCWTMNKELLYIDGRQGVKERQTSIRLFNDPNSEARVLLASIKACSEGIHLVGASRVVLLDVVWNPSVERQAISRAYRLGQQKDVFVYHLTTSGTLEEEKYRRQATKERLSELVFSSSEECIQKSMTRSRISEDHVLQVMTDHEKLKHIFKKIIYQPKADNLIESFGSMNF